VRNETTTATAFPRLKDESSVIERIKAQISAAPVVLYMKGTPDFPQCGFSAQIVRALQACDAQFAHHNILEEAKCETNSNVIRIGLRFRGCTSTGSSSGAVTS
jgi:hypothetical protein